MLPLFVLASAFASSTYPSALADASGMPCTPTCTVCHETNSGGSGTVVQAFGMAMMDRGLTGGSQVDLVTSAFDTLSADGVDSDGDGVTDADELAAGDNPNDDTTFCGGDAPLTPTYGCFNSAQSPVTGLAVLGAAAVVALGRRRR